MSVADDLRAAKAFTDIVKDFGVMSGGEFRKKYPDQGVFDGYGYLMRRAAALNAKLDKAIALAETGQ